MGAGFIGVTNYGFSFGGKSRRREVEVERCARGGGGGWKGWG